MGAPTSTIVERGSKGVSGKTAAGKHAVPGKTPTFCAPAGRKERENSPYQRLELSWREASEV